MKKLNGIRIEEPSLAGHPNCKGYGNWHIAKACDRFFASRGLPVKNFMAATIHADCQQKIHAR